MEKNVAIEDGGGQYLYHDPCHSPMKHHDPVKVAGRLLGAEVKQSDRCCGESGTFAISRPDIASQVRFRKQEELLQDIESLTGRPGKAEDMKILTSCPSCQQGLSRYTDDTGLKTDYIIIEMVNQLYGKDWEQQFIRKAVNGGIEKVLL